MAAYRDEVIRTCFEARHQVAWLENVEPLLKEQGLDAASIKSYWQSWNEKTEKWDWALWQQEATRFSTAVLEQMRSDYFDRVDTHLMGRWLSEKAHGEREKLGQVFGGTPVREDKPQERSKDQGREM